MACQDDVQPGSASHGTISALIQTEPAGSWHAWGSGVGPGQLLESMQAYTQELTGQVARCDVTGSYHQACSGSPEAEQNQGAFRNVDDSSMCTIGLDMKLSGNGFEVQSPWKTRHGNVCRPNAPDAYPIAVQM